MKQSRVLLSCVLRPLRVVATASAASLMAGLSVAPVAFADQVELEAVSGLLVPDSAEVGLVIKGASVRRSDIELVGVEAEAGKQLLVDLLSDYSELVGSVVQEDVSRIADELTALVRKRGYPIARVVLLQGDANVLRHQGYVRFHLFLGQLGKVEVVSSGRGIRVTGLSGW